MEYLGKIERRILVNFAKYIIESYEKLKEDSKKNKKIFKTLEKSKLDDIIITFNFTNNTIYCLGCKIKINILDKIEIIDKFSLSFKDLATILKNNKSSYIPFFIKHAEFIDNLILTSYLIIPIKNSFHIFPI